MQSFRLYKLLFFTIILNFCSLWSAEKNLIPADSWPANTSSSDSYSVKGIASGKKLIKINSRKKYTFSAKVQCVNSSAQIYIGLIPFDASRRKIEAINFHTVKKTETTLTRACSKGDKELFIDDASHWRVLPEIGIVAFDVDSTGNFNDLPNFKLDQCGITAKTKLADGSWKITLKTSVTHACPEGTWIREHMKYAYCMLASRGQILPQNIPQTMTAKFSGVSEDEFQYGKFWPGTVYIKPVVLNFVNKPFIISEARLVEIK